MKRRFGFVFALVVGVFSGLPLMGERQNVHADLSLRQQVEAVMYNLKVNLGSAPSLDAKKILLGKSQKQVQDLRSQSPIQFRRDELFLNGLQKGLSEIQVQNGFDTKSCEHAKSQWTKKKSEIFKAKSHPALFEILEKFCL